MELAGGSNGRIKPRHHDPVHDHRPSVDVLFRAVAGLGRSALSAILTSIGPDGAEELLGMRLLEVRPSAGPAERASFTGYHAAPLRGARLEKK